MRVALTGGTGYIGAAVLRELRAHDHEVVALVRSDTAAEAVTAAGAAATRGTPGWLDGTDAVIHLAALGPAGDDALIDQVLGAYAGTARRFVYTGGVWTWGANPAITEHSPQNPVPLTAWRLERQRRVLDSRLTASIVSPAVVYGTGRGIPVRLFTNGPRTPEGAVRLVGDGTQHWTTVHVDDLADLYVRVLEHAPGGHFYLGASGDNPTVRSIAEAAAGPGVRVAAESADESRERLGADYADALLLDQQAGEVRAKHELGWRPGRPGILTDLST